MEKECKKILLLKGLQPLNDDQFSMVKSLMDSDLKLTPKMKEEYTKVKIADMMQKKFGGITCVNKLLELLKDIEGLGDIVKTIKNERRKVMKKYKVQGPAPKRKRKQEASSTDESPSTTNQASEAVDGTLATKKKKAKATNNDKSKKTQPTQEWNQIPETSVTGARSPGTFSQPPRMSPSTSGSSSSTKKKKTLTINTAQPQMMQPKQGRGQLGQPSVTGAWSPGSCPQPPQMPPPTPGCSSSTKKKKTPTIKTAQPLMMPPMQGWGQLGQPSVTGAQSPGTFPQSPQMPPSSPGCSSATKGGKNYFQIKKTQTIKTEKPEMMQPTQGSGQLGQPSVTGAWSPGSCPQPPQMPPPTPGCSSLTKGEESYFQIKKTQTIKTEKPEMMQPMQGWGQLGQPAVTGAQSPGSFPHPLQMLPPTPGSSSATKKPRLKAVPTKASKEEGLQTGPKEVMVLKATEPFAYDVMGEERHMFHATVVTESQFFQVKVFHVSLKEKFIPKRVITISDYIGRNGFLEVYNLSSVSDVNPDRKMEVSGRLIQNANATRKIKDLLLEETGTFVSGVYQVHKKKVLNQSIIFYEIQDNTGKMGVMVYGRLTKVNCEEGDKLSLICFELSGTLRQLRSVTHSFIKVIKPRKNKKEQLNPYLYMQNLS
ncbi:interferon-activable protein 203-like isoform X1 [Hyaena hyaena]|uniref:interferon-activable protein 203-like isoform X1 n=1 Tax=Hyaena hyaena TaxID=95912 RepID=UPI001923499C|nr:interferon-activable protein 203-like isoform X1 [Hyaena hyaena]